MISFQNQEFRLTTEETSYWFRITPFGHLEHVYYGARLPDTQSMEPLALKHSIAAGGTAGLTTFESAAVAWQAGGETEHLRVLAQPGIDVAFHQRAASVLARGLAMGHAHAADFQAGGLGKEVP